jgi:hypothetical protein
MVLGETVVAVIQMSAAALALAILAAGCASSAPYTIPAMAINAGVAGGFSAAARAAGGCYATCTNGTACNTRTGLCDHIAADCVCSVGEICLQGSDSARVCLPEPMSITEQRAAQQRPVGFHVAPGSVPTLPPAKPSLEGP